MSSIKFENWTETSQFHKTGNKTGQAEEQEIEYRLDPLTGRRSVFNSALEDKGSVLYPKTDSSYLADRIAESSTTCFMCGDAWKKATPLYPETLISGGRLERGSCVLFPNLFPLAAYHAVVRVGEGHHLRLDKISPSLLEEAFHVSLEFIRRCSEEGSEIDYFSINANYLFPAGASIVHPHLQILGSRHPGTEHNLLLDSGRRYFAQTGAPYWLDLMRAEHSIGKRYIGRSGGTEWVSSFSPTGSNEVIAVFPDATNFLEWGESEVRGLAEGLSACLRAYDQLDYSTFNFSCYSGPLSTPDPSFRCCMHLINRQNVVPHYRADDYFFQKLQRNEIMIRRPEDLATHIRGTWKGK